MRVSRFIRSALCSQRQQTFLYRFVATIGYTCILPSRGDGITIQTSKLCQVVLFISGHALGIFTNPSIHHSVA